MIPVISYLLSIVLFFFRSCPYCFVFLKFSVNTFFYKKIEILRQPLDHVVRSDKEIDQVSLSLRGILLRYNFFDLAVSTMVGRQNSEPNSTSI